MFPLYDLFDRNDGFMMRAPILTIRLFLKLQEGAVARVQSETAQDPAGCKLHMNDGRGTFFTVKLASSVLGTEQIK